MIKLASEEVAAAAEDPAIAPALAARTRLEAAFAAQDVEGVEALSASDLIVNTPANRVARRDTVIGFFRMGRMNYESMDVTIDGLDARGDHVVIMGEEVVVPKESAPNAGRIVRRRFTDVWRRESDGQWRLTIRHATIVSLE
jgi:ketosteroid isomerase-like protein